jgi:Zn-dependent peptidase ImmA (M78 family)
MAKLFELEKEKAGRRFNGDRLRLARTYRNVSETELAERIGVQRQTISMYENNKLTNPEIEKLQKMSDILRFPIRFFMEDLKIQLEESPIYFRSLLTTKKQYKVEQKTKVIFINVLYNFLSDYLEFFDLNLPDIPAGTSPKEAASILREFWDLGDRPIDNIIYLVEKNGLIVNDFGSLTNDVDAYSYKIGGGNDTATFLIGYSKNKSAAARIHFDVAHELGHILLHNWREDLENIKKEDFKEIEKEANEFAAAFLLPEEIFISDIGRYADKLSYYTEMKKRWKVSIAAMIHRSYDLGLIDAFEYQKMMRSMQKKGIRKVEPLDEILKTSRPSLLKEGVYLLLDENVFNPKEFIDELSIEYGLSLYPEELEELLGLRENTLKIKNDYKIRSSLKEKH